MSEAITLTLILIPNESKFSNFLITYWLVIYCQKAITSQHWFWVVACLTQGITRSKFSALSLDVNPMLYFLKPYYCIMCHWPKCEHDNYHWVNSMSYFLKPYYCGMCHWPKCEHDNYHWVNPMSYFLKPSYCAMCHWP